MRYYQRQEAWVRREIRPKIARLVRLTNDSLRLGLTIIQKQRRTTRAGTTMAFMATRLLNDVRACELLAQTGYPLQALALAASAFELAYRALYVGKDDSRALAWARHSDLRRSYPPELKKTMQLVYEDWGKTAQEADVFYRNKYRALAAAKHANPKALVQFGWQRAADNTLHVYFGPVSEPATVKACQVALLECVQLLLTVLGSLVDYHLPTHRSAFDPSLSRLSRRLMKLGETVLKPR